MDFRNYQELAQGTDRNPEKGDSSPSRSEVLIPLLGLAGEVGELLSEYKKHLRDGNSHRVYAERVAEELGDLLWYVSNVATKFGLDLGAIAENNLAKCRDRWSRHEGLSEGQVQTNDFDAMYPSDQRLPRKLRVTILGSNVDGRVKVRAFANGAQLGNDLTDNAYQEDGYGFHDVFHLAYLAVLGWSPVIRAALGRKRKSQQKVDEVEDGGRAIAIEEGISALAFGYAVEHDLLDGVNAVSSDLLRTIQRMTAHLEVSKCLTGEWERAILLGFNVWRQIKQHGGGAVTVDIDQGLLTFEKATS